MVKQRTMRVASFAPELIELFRRAAREKITITLPTPEAATRCRQRMYDLRKALRAEQHDLANLAERAQVRLDGSVLIVEPRDHDIAATLRGEGITTDEPSLVDVPDEPPGVPITDEQAHRALTDFLKE